MECTINLIPKVYVIETRAKTLRSVFGHQWEKMTDDDSCVFDTEREARDMMRIARQFDGKTFEYRITAK